MSEKETGGPAFPFKCQGPTTAPEFYYGMGLRDYFAGQVIATLIQDYENDIKSGRVPHERSALIAEGCAIYAYQIADAMLEARK